MLINICYLLDVNTVSLVQQEQRKGSSLRKKRRPGRGGGGQNLVLFYIIREAYIQKNRERQWSFFIVSHNLFRSH